MFSLESSLHTRCCDISCILGDIDNYIARVSINQLNIIRWNLYRTVPIDDYYDLKIYRDILLSWANGNKDWDVSFNNIISKIKHILNK